MGYHNKEQFLEKDRKEDAMNKNIFRNLSYGVYVISTTDEGRATGCIANSAMQITSEPATMAVSMNHNNYTNSCIVKSGLFAVSILSEKSDPSIIGTFGFQSGKDVNKFATVDFDMVKEVPVVKDACGYLICKVVDQMETSTHTVFLGEVIDAEVLDPTADAMTYAYYHKVVKGKSPKNAPTYIAEDDETQTAQETAKKKYVCQICGYIYEGDDMPEDYKCPICGQGKDKFKEV